MTRRLIFLSAVGGTVLVAGVIGSLSGFFRRTDHMAHHLYHSVITWVGQPIDVGHILAGLGVVLVPVIILAVLFGDR